MANSSKKLLKPKAMMKEKQTNGKSKDDGNENKKNGMIKVILFVIISSIIGYFLISKSQYAH